MRLLWERHSSTKLKIDETYKSCICLTNGTCALPEKKAIINKSYGNRRKSGVQEKYPQSETFKACTFLHLTSKSECDKVLLFQMNDVIGDWDISGLDYFRQFVDSDELVSFEISCYGVRLRHYG
jgi:hypothetical protein